MEASEVLLLLAQHGKKSVWFSEGHTEEFSSKVKGSNKSADYQGV